MRIVLCFLVSSNLWASVSAGYLVKVKSEASLINYTAQTEDFSFEKIRSKVYLVNSGIEQLRTQNFIEIIEPNYTVSIDSRNDISDPYFEVSWGLENLGNNEPRRGGGRFPVPGKVGADSNIFPAWNLTKGSGDIVVAVIDTGIDYTHPDLKENMWINQVEANGQPGFDDDGNGIVDDIYGANFSSSKPDPMDDNMHGTHVAGIIGAKHNAIGVAGVMDNVSLMAVKFMDKKGRGDSAGAIKAIDYAVNMGAHIMNHSWGMLKKSQLVREALKRGEDKGVISIAAAGNSYLNNDHHPRFPASFDLESVITVAAYNAEDRLAGFSCFGPISVDLAAPGRNIISTVPKNKYKVLSGTSMAAPYVAGAVGLYLSLNQNASVFEVKEKLLETTTIVPHLKGKIVSEGRMNIGDFLSK